MSDIVKSALAECSANVRVAALPTDVDDQELDDFVAQFEGDFTEAITKDQTESNPKHVWRRDRRRVTGLARAIGSYAAFLAETDPKKPGKVRDEHLTAAYKALGPACVRGGSTIRKQYCTTVLRESGIESSPKVMAASEEPGVPVVVENALIECIVHVKSGVQTSGLEHPDVVRDFVASFRSKFVDNITKKGTITDPEQHTRIWNEDSKRVTPLARAIGALADFYAAAEALAQDPPKAPEVTDGHMKAAYKLVKDECEFRIKKIAETASPKKREELDVMMKYCI